MEKAMQAGRRKADLRNGNVGRVSAREKAKASLSKRYTFRAVFRAVKHPLTKGGAVSSRNALVCERTDCLVMPQSNGEAGGDKLSLQFSQLQRQAADFC